MSHPYVKFGQEVPLSSYSVHQPSIVPIFLLAFTNSSWTTSSHHRVYLFFNFCFIPGFIVDRFWNGVRYGVCIRFIKLRFHQRCDRMRLIIARLYGSHLRAQQIILLYLFLFNLRIPSLQHYIYRSLHSTS